MRYVALTHPTNNYAFLIIVQVKFWDFAIAYTYRWVRSSL
jgi:hypothetical protein